MITAWKVAVHYDHDYVSSLYNDLHHDMMNDPDIYHQEKEAIKQQFPEEYAGHETDPEKDAALHEHVKDSLFAQAKQSATDMYYENPLHHYYDEFGYDVYGNDDMGYSIKTPNGRFLDLSNGRGLYDISDVESALAQHHMEEGNLNLHDDGAKYEDYTLPGPYTEYREILSQLPANLDPKIMGSKKYQDALKNINTNGPNHELGAMLHRAERPDFNSSHYDQPNILGHLRLTNRNINGKRTLMVEEVQSDWHQKGRKEGYQTKVDTKDLIRDLTLEDKQRLGVDKGVLAKVKDTWGYYPSKKEAEEYLQYTLGNNGVPDAPFKKNWHEMLMKQALDIAAKGDYEGVAFTTGRQQVERYENSLRKAVDKIEFSKTFPNTTIITATKDGRNAFEGTVKDGKFIDGPGQGKTIEEVLGKGIANQVEEHKTLTPGVIEGKDLTIGGEGMKGFYDKILPDFINKYGKKWGIAVKKANLEHSGGNLKTEDIEEGIKNQGYTMDEYRQLPADEKMKIFNKIAGEEVHYFDMPEAAKKDILENGQPLFAGIGLAGVPMMDQHDQKKHGILKDIAKSKK